MVIKFTRNTNSKEKPFSQAWKNHQFDPKSTEESRPLAELTMSYDYILLVRSTTDKGTAILHVFYGKKNRFKLQLHKNLYSKRIPSLLYFLIKAFAVRISRNWCGY